MHAPRSMLLTGKVLASATVAAALVAIAPTGAGAATCHSWNSSPADVGTAGSVLDATAVTSACNAWAVGSYNLVPGFHTLIERWNGSGWTHVASPNPGDGRGTLTGVAATSTANAWAVGTFAVGSNTRTLTERWNGTRWQHVTSPNPGGTAGPISNELNAVAATSSSNAWAVGEYTATGEGPQPIVEHWNGHKWSSVTSWRPKGQSAVFLTGVTATSATNAWAVGYYETGDTDMTLVEHWNGKTWAKVASPNPSGSRGSNLDGVSASSAKNAWAVGFYLTPHGAAPLIEHWNGKTWQRVPSPNPGGTGELRGVVSIYSARAVAVGYSGATGVALVLRWNGRTWNQVSSPSPGTNSILDGVSGTSATNAGAVGYYVSSAGSNNLAVHV